MNLNLKRLCHMLPGERAVIHSTLAKGIEGHRLMDLGFVPGVCVEALHRSPFGDPTAYEVMGAVIALRHTDAKNILIEE